MQEISSQEIAHIPHGTLHSDPADLHEYEGLFSGSLDDALEQEAKNQCQRRREKVGRKYQSLLSSFGCSN